MDQLRFRSYFNIRGIIDYRKALGEARLLEIKEITKRETWNHAHARME